jgi:MerR family mercuric resistance operon transcriptional regulator
MTTTLTIGGLARATGVSPKTIRYYEQVGVLPLPARSRAGYRQYTPRGVDRLRFVHRARGLGLSLQEVRALSAVIDGPPGAMRPRLREAVREQLAAVRQRIGELQRLQRQLEAVGRRLTAASRRVRGGQPCGCLDAAGT